MVQCDKYSMWYHPQYIPVSFMMVMRMFTGNASLSSYMYNVYIETSLKKCPEKSLYKWYLLVTNKRQPRDGCDN